MLNFIKKHRYLFYSIGLLLVILLYYGFKHHFNLMPLGDSFEERYKFYYGYYDDIKNFKVRFWDFYPILGNNYYAYKAWFEMFSISCILSIFLAPSKDYLLYSIYLVSIIKYILYLVFTYMWLNKLFKSKLASALTAFSSTFSSYFLLGIFSSVLGDVYIFVPLMLYLGECFLEKRKIFKLSIVVFLMFLSNYYFAYIFIVFNCIYILIRYLTINKFTMIPFLKDALYYILGLVLGVGLSSILIYPVFYALTNSSRINQVSNFGFIGLRNLYRFLSSFFTNIGDWRDNYNYFVAQSFHKGISWGGGYSNFISYFGLYCLFIFYISKFKKDKLYIYVLQLLYFFFSLFFIFYFIFNLSLEARWLTVIVFIVNLSIAYVLSNLSSITKKEILISFIIYNLILSLFMIISFKFNLVTNFWETRVLIRNFLISFCVVSIYFLSFYHHKYLVVLFIILGFEGLFQLHNLYYNFKDSHQPFTSSDLNKLFKRKEVFDYLKKRDKSFYRISTHYKSQELYLNDPIMFNYHGFTNYESLIDQNTTAFYQHYITKNKRILAFNIKNNQILKNRLASKYLVTDDENYRMYGYQLIKQLNGFYIYENKYPFSIGLITKETSPVSFEGLNVFEKLYHLFDYSYSDLNKTTVKLESPLHKLSLQDGFYQLLKPNTVLVLTAKDNSKNTMSNLELYKHNNQKIKDLFIPYYDYYYDFEIDPNTDKLKIDNQAQNLYSFDYNQLIKKYPIYKERFLNDVSINLNTLTGTFESKTDGIMTLSLAYQEGFILKLNNQEIPYFKVNDGLIGFKVQAQKYHLSLSYIPPKFKQGQLITINSLIFLVLIYLYEGGKNRKKKEDLCLKRIGCLIILISLFIL